MSTDLEPTSAPARPLSLWWIAFGFIGAVILSASTHEAYLNYSGRDLEDPETLGSVLAGLAGVWVGLALGALCASATRPGGPPEQLGLRFNLPGDLLRGIGVGLLGQGLIAVIYLPIYFIAPDLLKDIGDPAEEIANVAHGWLWVPLVIAIAIVSPFVEELFFRGLVFRAIRARAAQITAIVISAALFGLAHPLGAQTPALIAFGVLLAWRAAKTGRLGESIFAHMTFNAFTLVILATS